MLSLKHFADYVATFTLARTIQDGKVLGKLRHEGGISRP
jgi:hypothetical protein